MVVICDPSKPRGVIVSLVWEPRLRFEMRSEQNPPKWPWTLGGRACGLRGEVNQGEHPNERQCFKVWRRKGSLKGRSSHTERMDKAHVMSKRQEPGIQQVGPMGQTLERLLATYLGPESLIVGQRGEVHRVRRWKESRLLDWDNKGGKEIQEMLGRDSV